MHKIMSVLVEQENACLGHGSYAERRSTLAAADGAANSRTRRTGAALAGNAEEDVGTGTFSLSIYIYMSIYVCACRTGVGCERKKEKKLSSLHKECVGEGNISIYTWCKVLLNRSTL